MSTTTTRYAIVRNARTRSAAAAYLPGNYRIIHEYIEPREIDRHARIPEPTFVIEGRDDHGWTMDDYVIPRYASGLIWAEEIDLSHPIMREIPALNENHRAVLIDGSLPRSEPERVEILLNYAKEKMGDGTQLPPGTAVGTLSLRWSELRLEADRHWSAPEEFFWNELEDDVIGLIQEILPVGWTCGVGVNDEPGDVLVYRITEEL